MCQIKNSVFLGFHCDRCSGKIITYLTESSHPQDDSGGSINCWQITDRCEYCHHVSCQSPSLLGPNPPIAALFDDWHRTIFDPYIFKQQLTELTRGIKLCRDQIG